MSDVTRPELRIVRGEPTLEELAAIAAVVTAAGTGGSPDPAARARPAAGRWNDPAYAHRRYWPVGPGGWRSAR
jgi:hypothetical protein